GPGCAPPRMSCARGCVDTATDPANCGGCGNVCALANATAGCAGGSCTIAACAAGYADCDHMATDGCEVNTQTDVTNCGACHTTCSAGMLCSHASCMTTCAPPLSTCGSAPSQYCANTAVDPANCGMCSHACALAN